MSTQHLLALLAIIFCVLGMVPFPPTWNLPERAWGWLVGLAVLLLAIALFVGS